MFDYGVMNISISDKIFLQIFLARNQGDNRLTSFWEDPTNYIIVIYVANA